MRRLTIFTLVLTLVLASLSFTGASETTLSISIDGNEVVFDESSGQPFIDENNRVQVPFRKTMEAFGAEVFWDGRSKTATAVKSSITIEVPIGEDIIYKNGEKIQNDTQSRIINDRTYLPIRVVLEAFWADVRWEASTKTFVISSASATPLMWLVTAPDGQIMYLFGSIHCAGEELYPLPSAITDAFAECEYLAVEFDIIAYGQDADAINAITPYYFYQDGKTIADEIGRKLYNRARAVLKEAGPELGAGFAIEALDNLKPAIWVDMLTGIAVNRAGLSFELGLDRYFLTEAHEGGIKILEVESVEDQVAMLLGFSLPLQAALLEGALDIELGTQGVIELYSLWKQGDEQALMAFLASEDELMQEELAKEYDYAILTKRNLLMAEVAERYMAEGKTVFYVVGLLHMLREDGIVELLRQNGYKVVRI